MLNVWRKERIALVAIGLVGSALVWTADRAVGQDSAIAPACLSPGEDLPTLEGALRDVADPQACEQWPALIPIRPDNPNLIWRDDRVLMVTWTRSCHPNFPDGLACQAVGDAFEVPHRAGSYALWVTTAPEVRAFVLRASYGPGLTAQTLAERLGQYLGLRPGDGEGRTFVEFWVHPDDLMRPCLDPDPTDTQCEVWLPATLADAPPEFRAAVGPTYPFTGLGYTYDWGNPQTEVGASEFVVKAGAIVEIAHISSTEDYVRGLMP